MTRWPAVIATLSAFVGPAASLLYETGRLRVFTSWHVGDAWFVAAIAAVALAVTVVAKFRGAGIAAGVSMVTNGAILALYGFIAAFFTLGGSR